MVGHGFHLSLDYMDSLLKWLPFYDCPQTILSNRLDLKPFKQKIFYIMKIKKFAQPIHHQAIQTLPTNMYPSLDPAPHLSQIGDEMKEGFPGIFKKRFEILTMNDETNIRCMIEHLKALHIWFGLFLILGYSAFFFPLTILTAFSTMSGILPKNETGIILPSFSPPS
jgi:hypothetical protein